MKANRLIASLALAILGLTMGRKSVLPSPGPYRQSYGRSPRHWMSRSSLRSPDESFRRVQAAHAKRARKAAKRLEWKAAGGERTLAQRTATG